MPENPIYEGFTSQGWNWTLVDAKNYNRLYDAAVARACADWLVGLNVSRALTVKYNASLSAGRVQTPTLGLIVEREKEIKCFVPKKFYQVHLKALGNDFVLFGALISSLTKARYFSAFSLKISGSNVQSSISV